MKILIVDDSLAMQAIVKRSLQSFGYQQLQIKQANDGEAALAIIRDWEPDLVLSDWYMPKMNGIELVGELKRQMLPIKVGFVTSENAPEKVQEALDAGARFVISKPFDDDSLHQAIMPLLQGADEAQAALTQTGNHDAANTSISLPSAQAIQQLANAFAKKAVMIEAIEPQRYSERWQPCFLGIMADEQQKVRAVCMLTLAAGAILGAAIDEHPDSLVHKILQKKTLPKPLLDNSQRFLAALALCFFNHQSQQGLQLTSLNLAPKGFSKLEQFLQKPAQERIDVEVAVMGYGQGWLTIVCT